MTDVTIDRRSFLIAGGAVLALPAAAVTKDRADAATELREIFTGMERDRLDLDPEQVTSLGLDTGARAGAKALLNDRSPAALTAKQSYNARWVRRLRSVDRGALPFPDQVNLDTVLYGCERELREADRFDFPVGSPYVVTQLSSASTGVPEFLAQQHRIDVRADADAYLSRVAALAVSLDQESECLRKGASLGVIAPDFILDRTLAMLKDVRARPVESATFVQALAAKVRAKQIDGNYERDAASIYSKKVLPALDRQIALLTELRGRARSDAGVWKFKNGSEYYQMCLRQQTTTDGSAESIHERGKEVVAELSSQIDGLLRAQGRTSGSVGERLRALATDPAFVRPNTDAAKEQLIAELNRLIAEMERRLPRYFNTLPNTSVSAVRIPQSIEAGAPSGAYVPGSMDGSRPALFYVNLRNTAELPSWRMSTLTFHETVPGHHMVGGLKRDSTLPLVRKLQRYGAYDEGWALYAEQLADEMGVYDNDPLGRVGYLNDALFRAARMVVDTGIHEMRWTRAQAIQYVVDTVGMMESAVASEVERYCVTPAQACSYMVGKLSILGLRERAQAALGTRFDIRAFHDSLLLSGPMPESVLSGVVERHIQARGEG
ncbi:DUF885 domain-containing protein [Steroidobacter flavus]|uniref:DUF885 domain-containing protein n=1 Tax=Steroidobacter flavus TaxID=1842136 RepID=A0ABV8SKT8_9GAMM